MNEKWWLSIVSRSLEPQQMEQTQLEDHTRNKNLLKFQMVDWNQYIQPIAERVTTLLEDQVPIVGSIGTELRTTPEQNVGLQISREQKSTRWFF